jgi:hypothetical protein
MQIVQHGGEVLGISELAAAIDQGAKRCEDVCVF